MATVAGKIQSLTGGKFFVKDEQGNIKEVSLNDDIYENSSVYGDSGNPSSAKVEIILSDNDVIVLSQGQKQLIDASLIETAFGTEELFFTREGLEQTIAEHNAIADVESDLREAKFLNDGNITEEETTEGDEEVEDEEGNSGQFLARDGNLTDIESDLRKKAWAITRTFNESERSKDLEGLTKKELGSNPSNPFTPTPVTPPPSTRPSTDNPPVNPNRPDSGGQRPDEPTPPKPPVVVPPTPTESAAKLSIDDQIIWEQDGQMWFTVTLDKPLRGDVTFTYKTSSGTATEGKDYIGKTGTITIPAGSTSVKIPIDILDDYFYEKSEYFNIDITNITGNINVNESKTHGTGTILDNPPTTNGEVVPKDPSNPDAPGKPDGEKGTYGPEDTVYAIIEGSKEIWESEKGSYTVKLVDKDGKEVTPTKDTTVTVVFTNKTTQDADTDKTDGQIITVTIKAGEEKSEPFNVKAEDDFLADDGEVFNLKITNVDDKGQFENVVIGDIKGERKDVDTVIRDNTNPTNPEKEPDNPETPGDNPGYGPEDTVYAIIEGSKEIWESESGSYTVKLVDKDGKEVIPTKDTVVTVVFTNKTTQDADTDHTNNQTITVTIPAGSSTSAPFNVKAEDDYLADDGEIFNLAIKNVDDQGQFENVAIGDINGNNKDVDTVIRDNSNKDNPEKEPDNPDVPGENPGFGPEDTVLIRLSQDATTQEFEGATLTHKISLVESDGTTPVILEEGKTVTVTLKYTDKDGMNDEDFTTRYKEVTITGDGKTSEFFFTNIVKDDFYAEGTEKYDVSIESIKSQNAFENLVVDKDNNLAKGEIIDNEPNKVLPNPDPTDPSVPGTPKDPSEPKDPNKPTEDKGYGEEDTVYVVITTNDVKYEGETLEHTIQLVDKNGNLVTIPEGEEITVQLVYKDGSPAATEGVDYTATKSITFTSTTGNTITIKNPTKDDYFAEGDEHYIVEVGNITQKDGKFENIEAGYSQSYKDKNNLSEDAGKTATGTIKDNPGNTEQPVVDPENPGTPDKPKEDGTPVYGPEDTVYVKLINSGSVTEAPADTTDLDPYTLKHKVQLVDKDGNPVEIPAGKSVTVVLEYKDIDGQIRPEDFNNGNITEITNADGTKSYQWTVTFDSNTPKNAGIYEIEVKNPAIYDNQNEGNEKYELTIGKITQSDKLFENIVKHPDYHTVTGEIIDKVPTPTSFTTPEDTIYNYKFAEQGKTISEVWINNGENFVKVDPNGSVDLFDNGKKVGTLTYDETNKQLVFTPVEDYSNYAKDDAIKFKYQAKFEDGTDEFKEVKVQVTPVADKPTVTVNNVTAYEDASNYNVKDDGNKAEGGNKIPLGLVVPSLSKDTTDKNNSGTNTTASGDHPERNGEITLTFTNGSDLVLKDSSDNIISGSGAKLIYTTTESGSVVEKELLINSDNQTVQVVIVNTSGGTDIDTNYHHSGTLPAKDGNVLYLTEAEYNALKIQHAEDNDTNISIKIGVSSYEVDDTNKPLASVTPASDEKTMTVEIIPVTDKPLIIWDNNQGLGEITAKGEKADALFNFKTTTQQETTTIDLQSIMSNTSGAQNGTGGTHGDLDGSEERTYIIEGLPKGAVVTFGGQTSSTAGDDGKVTIKLTPENNKILDHSEFKIELPPYFYGKIEGKITLSVIDKGVEETGDSSKWGKTETDSIEFVYKVAGASFSIGNPVGIEDAGRENSNYKNNENGIGREPHNSNGNITDPTKGIALNINPQYTLENNSTNEKITVNIAGLPKGSAMWIKDNTGADRLIGLDEDGKIYEYKQATSDPKEWTETTEYTGDNGITVTKSDEGDSYSIQVVDYQNVPTVVDGNITDYNYPVFIPPHNASTDSSSTSSKYQFDISGSITYNNGENGGEEKTLTFTDSNGIRTFPTHVEVAARADEPINTEIIDDTINKVVYLKEKSPVGEDGIKYELSNKDDTTAIKYIKAVEDTKFNLKDIYKNTPSSYDTDGSEKLSIKVTLPSDKYTLEGEGITRTGNTYTFDVSKLDSIKLGFPANVSGVSDKITLQYITTEYSGDSKTHFKEEVKFFIEAATDDVNVATGSTIYEDNQGHLYKDGENTKNKINLQATSKDTDGSESITSVKILASSVKTGYELYLDEAMTQSISSKLIGDYYVLTPQEANSIYGKNSADHKLDGDFTLKVVYEVKDTDGLNTKTSSVEKDHTVTVKAVTDAPTLAVTEIAAGTNNTVDTTNKVYDNPVVTVTGAENFTIKINTSSLDKDGSEKVEEVELRGVPDGVTIEGARWLYQTAGNNNVWVIDGANITSRDQTIDGDGSSMDIVFTIGNPNFVTQDITIITKTRDGDDYREEATQKVQLKSTIEQGDGEGLGTPVIIDLAFKEGAKIYEDNDSDPITNGKQDEYYIGHSITVAPQNSDGTAGGKWTVTITDLPTGVTLSGADYSYVDGGKTYYVISGTYEAGQSGTAVSNTIQNKLDSIKVNLPADKNSGQDTDSGKFLEMKFTATIQNESSGRYNAGTSIADTNKTPILPVTDKMTIAIGINNIDEDSEKVPLNITLTNPNDGNKTELVGNKLSIKVTETWKDAAVPEGAPGKLEVDETKYTVELKDGYYEITPISEVDKFTVGAPITGIYYTPAEDRAGTVKFEVKTQNKETGSTVIYDSSATKDITVKATWDTELEDLSVVGNSTEDTPASGGGVTLKNAVKLDIKSTSTSTDTSEKYTKITLDGIPNGLTVYYKDASGKLVSANNIGSTTTGGAYTLNPNKSDSVTGRNGWEVPVSNGVLPEIYVSAPENWAGEFTFTTKLTMSEYGLSDKTFDITDSKVTIDSVADGLQAGSATAQSDTAIFVYRTLNLNAQMKDVDGSEVLNLKISGLSSEANFQLTSGENLPYSNTFENGVWTINGIKQADMDKIRFVDFNASNGAIKVTATTQEIDSNGDLIAGKESAVHDFGEIGNIGVSGNNTISDNFTFSGKDLDFSKIADLNNKFNSVGTIDLSHANASSIKLSLQDVLDLADDQKNDLIIKGGTEDKVSLTGTGWNNTTTTDGTYTIYSSTDNSVKVKVENTINDQGIIS